jgi:hypothetical protein
MLMNESCLTLEIFALVGASMTCGALVEVRCFGVALMDGCGLIAMLVFDVVVAMNCGDDEGVLAAG